MFSPGRISGVLLPLFSLRSIDDAGIGDFGALEGLFQWMNAARQKILMLLPLLPTLPGDTSPYATRSAFGLNPVFIDLSKVPEFAESGGWSGLPDRERHYLDEARGSKRIRYDRVLALKGAALQRAFTEFERRDWKSGSDRAAALRRYQQEQGQWLEPFALFCAISDARGNQAWWEWPDGLRTRNEAALAAERERLWRDVLFHTWQQWIAETQWQDVRKAARGYGVFLCGDEPFIVGQDSVDTWSHPEILRRDARLGVPPDPFSATGQDWGLPYFDFTAMEKEDFAWLKFRAERTAAYYDVRRVDHALGYFRQWIRDEKTPAGRFIPPDEPSQRAQGERLFRLLSASAGIIAEDLGMVPDFVRETLPRLAIPGYRVLRWERDDGRYRDPQRFPKLSVVTTGTHDTETLPEWWESLSDSERAAVAAVYSPLRGISELSSYSPAIHQALLASAEHAGSDLCIFPWQDVFASRERINLPGSISQSNWAYRIEQSVDQLLVSEAPRNAAALLARLSEDAGR